ncbi:MAG: aminotransferase class V-fold PLP-dependent enzyme [Myxococcota bacterium]
MTSLDDAKRAAGPAPTAARATFGDRTLFPAFADGAFFNHAAISVPSSAVREQVSAFLEDYTHGGVRGFKAWLPQKARFKEKLAAFVGAHATDLAFVNNTTTGISNIALSYPWKAGDRILLFRGDFPANVTPWQQAARAFGAEIVWSDVDAFHESYDAGMAAFRVALKQHRPRLVATSFVRFQTGLRLPVHAMAHACHAADAEIFVDGIQGIGAVPFEVGELDYVAWGGHKWMMGLEGLGYLYVSPKRMAALIPRVAGWLSHESALDFLFLGEGHLKHDLPIRKEASAFELGASAGICAAGSEAALDLIQQLDAHALFDHLQSINDALEAAALTAGLTSERHADPRLRSGSLCLRTSAAPVADIAAAFDAEGIRITTPDGRLRLSPHWWTSHADVERVLASKAWRELS